MYLIIIIAMESLYVNQNTACSRWVIWAHVERGVRLALVDCVCCEDEDKLWLSVAEESWAFDEALSSLVADNKSGWLRLQLSSTDESTASQQLHNYDDLQRSARRAARPHRQQNYFQTTFKDTFFSSYLHV